VKIFDYLIDRFYYLIDGKKKRKLRIDTFLNFYFKQNNKKFIIQVGGNDGINSDPLRKYLKKKGNYKVLIIEPLNYYYKKLKKLYFKRKDIKIIKTAISNKIEKKFVYFIDPKVVKEMNGKGPHNNWADGQGSFDVEIVKYWIKKNSFRGYDYKKNIPKFIQSIKKESIITKKISSINIPPNHNTLLIIDVQGYELEVIESINWRYAPKHIIYEDDLKIYNDRSNKIRNILRTRGYKYIGGKYDKIFSKNKTRKLFFK
jgi:FkbM family methyltransferase|tara:strand:- start:125 stop:898 length:774 start_codon:yes stop_codon:yes gene_type:complete